MQISWHEYHHDNIASFNMKSTVVDMFEAFFVFLRSDKVPASQTFDQNFARIADHRCRRKRPASISISTLFDCIREALKINNKKSDFMFCFFFT